MSSSPSLSVKNLLHDFGTITLSQPTYLTELLWLKQENEGVLCMFAELFIK